MPEEFVAVASTADIPPGAMKCVAVDRVRVLLANVGGMFYAIGDMCGHRRAPLSAGVLDGYLVEPLHYGYWMCAPEACRRPDFGGCAGLRNPGRWRYGPGETVAAP